jgi:hypothetical protein
VPRGGDGTVVGVQDVGSGGVDQWFVFYVGEWIEFDKGTAFEFKRRFGSESFICDGLPAPCAGERVDASCSLRTCLEHAPLARPQAEVSGGELLDLRLRGDEDYGRRVEAAVNPDEGQGEDLFPAPDREPAVSLVVALSAPQWATLRFLASAAGCTETEMLRKLIEDAPLRKART